MANSFLHVTLEKEDVPGAVLPLKDISSNNVVALKRWLETRALCTTGNKAELVQRVETCICADLPIDVKVDNGKWYELKLQKLRDASPLATSSHLPVPPVTGWADFPSAKIPEYFNKGHIHHYLYETAVIDGLGCNVDLDSSKFDVKTEKPLKRGIQFFKSGHVQDMKDCLSTFYYVKCVVRASFENVSYNVLAAIDTTTGFVRDASCDCKASAMGRCSHVAGLLIAVSDYLQHYGSAACTSRPCEWNKGRKRLRSPKKLTDCHVKENKKFIAMKFDPRPLEHRPDKQEMVNNFKSAIKDSAVCGWSLIFAEEQMTSIAMDYVLDGERNIVLKLNREQFLRSLAPDCKSTMVEIV